MFNRKSLIAVAVVAGSLGFAGAASAQTVVALSNNSLVMFDAKTQKPKGTVKINGATVIGIDVRPADGQLYGLTPNGWIVTIDPKTGKTTQKSELSTKLKSNTNVSFDFNPAADRLRIVSPDGTSLRVNVDDGKVTVDGNLKFAETDMHKGEKPNVVAVAYTNSVKGTKETTLYDIDATLGALLRQAPPNDGTLNAVGKLGIKLNGPVAFNIVPTGEGQNEAWLLNGGTLYKVDLATGKATPAGKIAGAVSDITYLDN
jgi:hypothetical protein